MTEHSKIPFPPKGNGKIEVKPVDSSLFERASGAFGLNAFSAAPVPKRVMDAPMKHARPVKRKAQPQIEPEVQREPAPFDKPVEAAAAPAPAPARAPVPETHEPEPEVVAPSLPATIAPANITVQQNEGARIHFGGEKHKIDRKRLRDQGMIVPGGSVSGLLEEFRIVKRRLLAAAKADEAAQRVLICSPLPGEGKTYCAVNLALAMAAEKDSEVLLVDADFAKPSVLSALGLPGRAGLMDALSDPKIKVEDLVLATDIPGLFVLPAGEQTDSDSEYLTSARTAEVLHRLTRGAPNRMVIFDSPPALAASPAAELAKHVGQAVLVARADSTGQSALEDAYQLLSGCPDIKLLLNAVQFSPSGRRFGTYYGYEG